MELILKSLDSYRLLKTITPYLLHYLLEFLAFIYLIMTVYLPRLE